jgi:hypothetical protein
MKINICKANKRKDWWNIEVLREHAEEQAKCWRIRAVIPAAVASVPLLTAAIAPWCVVLEEKSLTLIIVKLSVLLVLAAFLMLFSRILWNYSNVWLGRAGTLEDLGLALKLIGKPPTEETPLYKLEDTQRLLLVVTSLERLRRVFEGDLLKGPALEVPSVIAK